MSYRKKLIEVSLPLEAINIELAREKSIRHGHPSTLHLWWARRPLAACRAVLWSSLVDDPSEYMPDEELANRERDRLFAILEKLVLWKNINNEEVLDAAKLEIARSVARDLGCDVPVGKEAIREFLATKAPPVLDPFAGGGSIPLEAQRLGLRAYASDLNPVAVLINKALIEIPPRFAGMPPVHPPEEGQRQESLLKKEWKGAEGLAEDVRYYGKWMRDEAEKRIGHLYPKVKITADMLAEREDLKQQGLHAGDELTVIAWLWARTVKCPNPACGIAMPLVSSFMVSAKKNKQVWVEPAIDRNKSSEIKFKVKTGKAIGLHTSKVGRGSQFSCVSCGEIASDTYIKAEGMAGRIGSLMMAEVLDSKKGRIYLPPSLVNIRLANTASADWRPEYEISNDRRAFWCPLYGIGTFDKLFTERQLSVLNTFSELVSEVYKLVKMDASHTSLNTSNEEYSKAVSTYLGISVSRLAN